MDTAESKQQLLDYDKLNEIKKQLLEKNQQMDELNLQLNDILIPLYYHSLITFFFNTYLKPKFTSVDDVSRFITVHFPNDPAVEDNVKKFTILYTATLELISIIEPKYQALSTISPDEKTLLLNYLVNLYNRLDFFFTLFASTKFIDTHETNIGNYLESGFRSDANTYGSLVELIDKRIPIDKEIERLRDDIYKLQQEAIVMERPEQLTSQQMQLQQTISEQNKERAKTSHLFLLVCHGSSVSQFKTYFKTRAYFKNIEYMIPFGQALSAGRPSSVPEESRKFFFEDMGELHKNINSTPTIDATKINDDENATPTNETANMDTEADDIDTEADDIDTYLERNRVEQEIDGVKYKGNEIIVSDNQYAYLPPMVFTPVTNNPNYDDKMITSFDSVMGLYHYALIQHGDSSKYNLVHTIADYNALVKNLGGGSSLTYSQITNLVREYFKNVKKSNIDIKTEYDDVVEDIKKNSEKDLFEKSSIIFHTCRSYFYGEDAISNNILKHFNSTVVISEEPTPANIMNELSPEDTLSLLSIDVKNFNIGEALNYWKGALVGLFHQGCGINVLNFYNLLPLEQARGAAACVNVGTSMFKIADYIKDKLPIGEIGVCRMPIGNYIILIQNVINEIVKYLSVYSSFSENNYFSDIVFILRIYGENKQKDSDAYNEIGHFISICLKDNHIYFIDPQTSFGENLKYEAIYVNTNAISEFLNKMFAPPPPPEDPNSKQSRPDYSNFKFCDFYLYKNPVSPLNYNTIMNQYGGVIRSRPEKLSFGGKTPSKTHTQQKKRTTHKKGNKSRNTHKARKSRKNKHRRIIKTHKQRK